MFLLVNEEELKDLDPECVLNNINIKCMYLAVDAVFGGFRCQFLSHLLIMSKGGKGGGGFLKSLIILENANWCHNFF